MENLHSDEMILDAISIARCREVLGDEAQGLSDRDVDQIRQHAERMARMIVEIFLQTRATQE